MTRILGLYINEFGYLCDKFDALIINNIKEALAEEEEDLSPYERRFRIVLASREAIYRRVMEQLAEESEYWKQVSRSYKYKELGRGIMKKIRVYVWDKAGYLIPLGSLPEKKAVEYLRRMGCTYRKAPPPAGWYREGLYIGKNRWESLRFLGVDGCRLCIRDKRGNISLEVNNPWNY